MKIYCTVEEFGQIVRGCARSTCYSCALNDVCSAIETEDTPKIERLVRADTITDGVPEAGADG